MSDEPNDMFDWGEGGLSGHEAAEAIREIRAAERAKLEAEEEARKERRGKEYAEILAKVLTRTTTPLQDESQLTHIWIGKIEGDIRQASKSITGNSLDKTRYIRPREHIYFSSSTYKQTHPNITNEQVKPIAIMRLTKTEAVKAKLSSVERVLVMEDLDGAVWWSMYKLIHSGRLRQDQVFQDKEWNMLLGLLEKVV